MTPFVRIACRLVVVVGFHAGLIDAFDDTRCRGAKYTYRSARYTRQAA